MTPNRFRTVQQYEPVLGLGGFGYVNEILSVATAAYGMFGPKPKVDLDAVVFTQQPPPPVYQNWTPAIVIGGFAAVALTLILTKPKRK